MASISAASSKLEMGVTYVLYRKEYMSTSFTAIFDRTIKRTL